MVADGVGDFFGEGLGGGVCGVGDRVGDGAALGDGVTTGGTVGDGNTVDGAAGVVTEDAGGGADDGPP